MKSTRPASLTADADPMVAHVAVNVLVRLNAIDAAMAGPGSADARVGAGSARVLQALHDPKVVEGLIGKLAQGTDPKRPILQALCRLDLREADWDGGWWGTRPDTTGPYYKPVAWEQTETINRVLRAALRDDGPETVRWLLPELLKNRIDFEEATALLVKLAEQDPAYRTSAVDLLSGRPTLDAASLRLLAEVAASDKEDPVLRAKVLRGLQQKSGPRPVRDALIAGLAAVGRLDAPPNDLFAVWRDFARDGRHAGNLSDFLTLADDPDPARGALGYAVLLNVEEAARSPKNKIDKARAAEARQAIERGWRQPESAARLLRAIGLARFESLAGEVKSRREDPDPKVRAAAVYAAQRLDLDRPTTSSKPGVTIAKLPFEQVVAHVQKEKGDSALGARLFEKPGCVNCHTVSPSEALKGPFLGGIATRYSRAELTEAILRPSSKLAQGFETQRFATVDGQIVEGFVVRESGDAIEYRNSKGEVAVLAKKDIEERGKSPLSIMPTGLADPLTVAELASVLAYLESLKAK